MRWIVRFEEHVVAELAYFGNADALSRNVWAKFAVVHEVLHRDAVQEKRGVGYQSAMTAPPEGF